MSETTGLVEVGVRYCSLHHGVMNEDDDRCDFSANDLDTGEVGDDGEPRECEPRQLYYVGANARPSAASEAREDEHGE